MKKTNQIALIAALILATGSAQAQWYAGATAGESRSKLNGDGLNDQFLDLAYTSSQTRTDNRDSAFRVFGGYQLNRYFAVEAGYADLGTFGVRSTVTPAGTFEKRIEVNGVDVNVVGTLPIANKWTLFARAGAFRSERKASYETSGSVELLRGVQVNTEKKTQSVFGAGVVYDITPAVGVRAEWARHGKYSDDLLDGGRNIDAYSVGVVYRFR